MARNRPGTVTKLGYLNVIYGLAMLAAVWLLFGPVVREGWAGLPDIWRKAPPIFHTWLGVKYPLEGLTALALVIAGIGLLRLKKWARLYSLVYGVYGLVMAAATVGMKLGFLLPASRGPDRFVIATTTVITAIVTVIYPGALLVLLVNPKVKAAFGDRGEEDEA
ncbi:MAG: hypothetical protein ACOC7T_05860 [Planctomycetota bacterium]